MQNTSKDLLKAKSPIEIQKRETMNKSTPHKHALTEAKISLANPLEDYKNLIKQKMEIDEMVPDEVLKSNFSKIGGATRKTIWNLLFADEQSDGQEKAATLLKLYKSDCCFYDPWEYNNWVPSVRDELLKRKMLNFWCDQMVKKELGPCWARDSDFFDDTKDPEPAAFYKHAGCEPPFNIDAETEDIAVVPASQAGGAIIAGRMSEEELTNFTPVITKESPLQDYRKIMEERVLVDYQVDEEILQDNYRKIAAVMRDFIFKLLFPAEGNATEEDQKLAAELLKEHKRDAAFHSPWDYNDWIPVVRDEVLKRNMLDFWREHMVKKELGLCWARDSDYFDDMDDPAPAAFYNYAGGVAPFQTS